MSKAIGIDLGTTYSCVAHFANDRVEIIANDQGSRTTPSFVAFTETERLIGEAAQYQAALNPENTVFDAKRLIGRKIDDPDTQNDIKYFPFKVTDKDGKPEISSMVLTKMKDTAEKYLATEIKDAVVTVPAYFNDSQRQDTKDAGRIAGLNVLRIINEPTAAAIAYGLEKVGKPENVLVFDLGGGTFDVSLLKIDNGLFEVKATGGDTHLGGEDFDNILVNFAIKEFKRKTKLDISNNQWALRRLRTACERAKRVLSSGAQTTIEVDSLYEGADFHTVVTRARFEDLCHDLFESTIEVVASVLKDSELTKSEVDEIVLVGGSTRIPKVRDMVSEFFNGKKLNHSINPDEAVASGAAVQAAMLTGNTSSKVKDLVFSDVTPLSLGVHARGGLMSIIIPRNSPVPVTRSEIYHTISDNQTQSLLQVFEGERPLVKDNTLLGEFLRTGMTPAPRGVTKDLFTFEIDADGILTVTATEPGTDNSQKMTITSMGRLSPPEIARMVKDARKFKLDDKQAVARVKARNNLESYVYTIKSTRRKYKNDISPNDFSKLNQEAEKVGEWLDENPSASTSQFQTKQRALVKVAKPIMDKLVLGDVLEFEELN